MDFLATSTRRRVLFSSLYLSEGAPIGFLWLALPTWLRVADVPIERITSLAAVLVVPWTFKFAWAPLVDLLQTSWWTTRQWIVASQLLMGAALAPLLWLSLENDFTLIFWLLLLHAFAAATQDVAIDALCIATTDPAERGRLNGWMQAGMLIGRALFGGGALMLGRWLGFSAIVFLLILVTTGSLILVVLSSLPTTGPRPSVSARRRDVVRNLAAAVRERRTWLGLLFALTGGAAFKSLEVVFGPFLIDRGYEEHEVGMFSAGPMIALMIAGSLSGGWLADRLPRRALVAVALLGFVIPIASLAASDLWLEATRGSHLLGFLSLTAFGIGMFTAASYALFMDLTRPEIAATQFSAFMGATNACESWSSYTIGRLIAAGSYPLGFAIMGGISLASLAVLHRLPASPKSR